MKKTSAFLIVIFTGIVVSISLLTPVLAVEVNSEFCSSEGAGTEFCDTEGTAAETATNNSFVGEDGVITNAASLFVRVTTIVSVIMIVIGGLRFVISGGAPEATAGARNTIIYAVIGLALAVSAQLIIVFVLSKL